MTGLCMLVVAPSIDGKTQSLNTLSYMLSWSTINGDEAYFFFSNHLEGLFYFKIKTIKIQRKILILAYTQIENLCVQKLNLSKATNSDLSTIFSASKQKILYSTCSLNAQPKAHKLVVRNRESLGSKIGLHIGAKLSIFFFSNLSNSFDGVKQNVLGPMSTFNAIPNAHNKVE